MAEYEGFPIETDPTTLAEEAFAFLQSQPGWEDWIPNPANFDAGSIEAHARIAAEVRDVAATVPDDAFVRLGELAGIGRIRGAAAAVTATVTAVDALGYTLEEGTVVGVRSAGDAVARFVVTDSVTVPAGATSAGGVRLVAEDDGADANDLGAFGEVAEVIDRTLPWATITLSGPTGGGADEETIADYLDRVTEELTLASPRPIVPRDFAVLARRVSGVERALAVDLYQPDLPYGPGEATNIPRCVTVFVVNDAGGDPGQAVRDRVRALLQSLRESTFLVYVAPPTSQTVSVDFRVKAVAGYEPADVQVRAEAAVAEYLDPAAWGIRATGGSREWFTVDRVRRTELYEVLNRVDGVDYVEDSLTINGQMADLLLTSGVVVMPAVGSITGTVV